MNPPSKEEFEKAAQDYQKQIALIVAALAVFVLIAFGLVKGVMAIACTVFGEPKDVSVVEAAPEPEDRRQGLTYSNGRRASSRYYGRNNNHDRILMNRYGKTFEELFSAAERVTA